MNDDFLYLLREEPEPEFANNLREQLTQQSSHKLAKDRLFFSRTFPAKRMVWALALFSLVCALTLIILLSARAAVADFFQVIIMKGVTVWVSDDVPAVKGESETYSDIWTAITPADLSTSHPIFAKMPAWVPADYVLQERAALFASPGRENMAYSALLEWKNSRGEIIQLKISKGSCPNGQLWESGEPRSDCAYRWSFNVDSKRSPELISIHNQPAIYFPELQMLMDLTDPIKKWNPTRVKYDNRDPEASFWIWESNGMRFEMAVKSGTTTQEDLIRFAESIP